MSIALTVLALSMPAAQAPPLTPVAVQFQGNNGSLPPPYHRATEIHIDADGKGTLVRRHGYDRVDPAQRFEVTFELSPSRQQAFARRMQELGALRALWREQEHPPVGGPVISVRLTQGNNSVEIPAFPVADQRELAEAVRAEVLALVPETAAAARAQWEQSKSADPE